MKINIHELMKTKSKGNDFADELYYSLFALIDEDAKQENNPMFKALKDTKDGEDLIIDVFITINNQEVNFENLIKNILSTYDSNVLKTAKELINEKLGKTFELLSDIENQLENIIEEEI